MARWFEVADRKTGEAAGYARKAENGSVLLLEGFDLTATSPEAAARSLKVVRVADQGNAAEAFMVAMEMLDGETLAGISEGYLR